MAHLKCTTGGEQPHAHKPDAKSRAKVEGFVMAGFNQDTIANYFQISIPTLYKHYRKELDETMLDKTMVLSNALFKDALDGDKQAREFWLKHRAKWSPGKPVEDKEKDDKMGALLEKLVDKL